ncbi:MAG: PAS domain S-box protein, partial [Phormidium sp.]
MALPRLLFLQRFQVSATKIPLRWLLVIPFVVQTVGATALVGYLSYRSGQQSVKNLADQLLRQTSERVSDRLTSYLQPSQQVVESNHLAVKQGFLDLNNPEQLRRHLWQQLILNPSIPSILFWSEQGDGIGYGRINSHQKQNLARDLTGKKLLIGTVYLYKLIPNQRRYYLVDPQGKPQKLIYTFKDDFRKLTWYRQAKAVNKQQWTPVFVGRVLPNLQIIAVAPVYNATGKIHGLFTCNYLLAEFSNFLNQLRFSPTGKVFIIDKSGNLIATSVLSEATGTKYVNGKPTRLPAVNSQDELTRRVSQQLLQKFGSFHNLKDAKQLSLKVNHHWDFVQVTPFKDKYGLDWLVVTVIPESDFMTEIQNNTRTTILLCLLTLSMAIASGLIIAHRFTTSITRLNRVSQQLAAGDLTQRLPNHSSILEVQELGQSFNVMADQLEQSFDRLQNALEESEEKFTTVFRASPDPMGITDAKGRFLEVNNRMLELYGYSREEIIGQTALELGLWTNLKEREQFRHLLATQGSAYNIEVLSQTKTGEIKTVLLAAEVCDLQGQKAVIAIVRDISERARLEAALRHSEAKFQELAAASPAIIFSLKVNAQRKFQYEYLNPVAEVIHEVPLADLLRDGSWALNQTHPDDLAEFQRAVADSLKTLQPFENERRIITPSGKIRWLSVSARCQRRETGELVWHGIAIDISDRKQAEIALLQSELKFATIFLDSPQPAWIATLAEGRCLDVNDSFTLVLGYSRIQAIGKTYIEMQLWTDLTDLQYFHASLLKYGRIDNFEIRFRTRSGEVKTVLLSARVSYLDEQDCVIGVLNDISDRKAAEIALQRYERIVSATTDGIA